MAAKLQAKLAAHMAALPAERHQQLHLLHHMLCLETAARQEDGAAMLQCLSRLQPHAAALGVPQRAAVLGMVGSRHSRVVQEAACQLLLDSVAAEGTLEAFALLPAVLSQLSLCEEHCLRAGAGLLALLAALPDSERSPGWSSCGQVRDGERPMERLAMRCDWGPAALQRT